MENERKRVKEGEVERTWRESGKVREGKGRRTGGKGKEKGLKGK